MSEQGNLAIIPRENALQVFTAADGLDPYLQMIRLEIDQFKPDITTAAGRQAIASIAYKVAKSKTYLDSVGKDLADVQKEIPKKIDAARKKVRDTLDAWKDEVRKPLTDWEEADKARIAAHELRLSHIDGLAADLGGLDPASLAGRISMVNEIEIGPHLQEFKVKTEEAKEVALRTLTAAHAIAVKNEADAAELQRLRDEAVARQRREIEERIAKDAADEARAKAEQRAREAAEAAERAAREAQEAVERKARKESEAAQRREAALKAEAEAAERRRQAEADAAVAREAELERQREEADARAVLAEKEAKEKAERDHAAKIAAERAETAKREKDKAHRALINRTAAHALVANGVDQEMAKKVIELIAKKAIPAISIAY